MLKPESAQSVNSDVKRSQVKHESYVIGKTASTQLGNRPWAIVRLLPKAQRYVVARFFNRQDADDQARFLRRFIPTALFEVIFEPPEAEEQL